jgi:hypothetical protein
MHLGEKPRSGGSNDLPGARNRLGMRSRPQRTPSHLLVGCIPSTHSGRAARPPNRAHILVHGATLASPSLQSCPANHCPCRWPLAAADQCRSPTGVESSSQSSDIKPLCSGPYPLAYEATHSTPHREALKNSNVRPGALLHAVMTRTNNSLRARCRGDVPPSFACLLALCQF